MSDLYKIVPPPLMNYIDAESFVIEDVHGNEAVVKIGDACLLLYTHEFEADDREPICEVLYSGRIVLLDESFLERYIE